MFDLSVDKKLKKGVTFFKVDPMVGQLEKYTYICEHPYEACTHIVLNDDGKPINMHHDSLHNRYVTTNVIFNRREAVNKSVMCLEAKIKRLKQK